ncbi:MAG: cephalosporin hydroxylase [Acidobacteria bacterium]|nr:MAG: cephalosporin hydroxylase [Acidobacteriota bacterium]
MLASHPLEFLSLTFRGLVPLHKEYRTRLRMTLFDWIGFHEKLMKKGQCRWMGVRADKNPLDAWIYQEILFEVRPEVVIEIGSYQGGSTLFLAHLLELIGDGFVISVDIDRSEYKVRHPRIIEVTGESSSSGVISRVADLCRGRRGLVIHDADHLKEQVLKDLANYAPLVGVGSYFIVEDSVEDLLTPFEDVGQFHDGPLAAIEEFLKENRQFEVDVDRERYILSNNPRGFLKRTK